MRITGKTSWVYPRVCGGTSKGCHSNHTGCGLSPRVRGNLVDIALAESCIRSIPACAGEPLALRRNHGLRRVYPRVCGGTESGGLHILDLTGLSPRVRGNQVNCVT